jgi:hypothetical protein
MVDKRDCVFMISSFKKLLTSKGYSLVSQRWVNQNRDLILFAKKNGFFKSFYVKEKHDVFYSFAKIFPNQKGAGDSINKNVLENLIKESIDVLVFEHEHLFYFVKPKAILNYATEMGLIRRQDVSGEVTYSFPLSLLKNFEKEFDVNGDLVGKD